MCGGQFAFYVPNDWTDNGTFTFENLCSKYADNTYGPLSANGTSRYSIAPTTAWKHRYYAYYKLEVNLKAGDYTANVNFKKVYDSTCYENDATDAMF